jgi:alanine racemase
MNFKEFINLIKPKSSYQSLNTISISTSRIIQNLSLLQKLQPNQVIIPVVKSNAYGHGLKQICQILNTITTINIPLIAVDSYPEYQIVADTTNKNILVLWETLSSNYHLYNSQRTHLAVSTLEVLKALIKTQKHRNIHLFLNTGMNREWFQDDTLQQALTVLKTTNNIKIVGVMSHLANADMSNNIFTHKQVETFKNLYQNIINAGYTPSYVHIANSAGMSKINDPLFTASRTGLAIYGYNPLEPNDEYYSSYIWLQPALRLTSTITSLQYLHTGEWVSYGLIWKTKKPTTLATLPLGYNEWLPRLAGEWYTVYHKDQEFPLRGRICMNLCSCDIGNLPLHIGDQIEVIWWDQNQKNTIWELNTINNTISYVTLTSLNSSIRRIVIE